MAEKMCTSISFLDMETFTQEAREGRLNASIKIIYDLFDRGYSVIDILDSYFIFVKMTDTMKEDEKYLVVKLLTKYVSMFYTVHEDEIELAFFANRLTTLLET
jgi:predicted GNAT superfamily acetyltransferase